MLQVRLSVFTLSVVKTAVFSEFHIFYGKLQNHKNNLGVYGLTLLQVDINPN